MKIRVLVRLKPGVLDVQGKAVEGHLDSARFSDVRIGKLVEMNVASSSFEEAKKEVEVLCQSWLVNPVIESYEIQEAR